MAGISSRALEFGNPENNKKYNGIEKENDLQIEIYDAPLRELDGQVGVWWQIDPKTENMEMWSPYVSNYDNPLRYSDPLGDEGQQCCTELWNDIKDAAKETWSSIKSGASEVKNFSVDFYKNGVLPGLDFLNETINPLVSVAEVASGKSYSSNFTENKPRLQSGAELAITFIPGGKVEGTIAKTAEKALAKEEVKQIEKATIKTANGTEIKGFTGHGVNRAIERGVKPSAIKDAIKNPLKVGEVVTDKLGRQSQRYVGKTAEVVVNPQVGKIVSVNPTSTKKATKLMKNLSE